MPPRKKASSKSENPAYPDAAPTAPGGMSQANLRVELAEKHGISMHDSRDMSWTQCIDAVIEGRLLREAEGRKSTLADDDLCDLHELAHCAECDGTASALDASLADESVDAEDMFEDLDDLLDEAEDFGEAEPAVGVIREQQLRGMQAPALKSIAREYGIQGYSTQRRADLITAIIAIEAAAKHVSQMNLNEDPADVVMAPLVEPFEDMDAGGVFDPEQMYAEITQAYEEEQAKNPPLFLGIPGLRDYVFDGHAGAGPSGAERWMNCTMSLTASRAFLETLSPNQQRQFAGASTAARQGTTAHSVGETEANLMLGRITQEDADTILLELTLNPDAEDEAYNEEMGEYVTEYVDLVKSYADDRGVESIKIEQRIEAAIPLTGAHEGEVYVVHGSLDFGALPDDTNADLVVGDLKYGEGVYVEVEENPQVRFYALGLLALLTDEEGNLTTDVETVTYYIAQPRLGGIRTWTESIDDLFDWRDDVLAPALTQALYGAAEGASYAPSEVACQWCPARGGCPALTEARLEQAADLFDVIVEAEYEGGEGAFPETASMSNDRLGELLRQITGLIDIHADLKEEAQRRLHRGVPVPGYKLVNYSPPRKWKDGAEKRLAKAASLWKEPVLVSPTAAEKILGPEKYARIEQLVDKPEKRPVIGTENDRRKEWAGKPPEQMFDDESETEE